MIPFKEFTVSESADPLKEAATQSVQNMDTALTKLLGGAKSRKSGRTEFEYTLTTGKRVYVDYGGEDEPYAIVSFGGKEKDITKGKDLAGLVAQFIGVKPE